MRIVVTALGCVLLAGCAATVGEMEAAGPNRSFTSEKPVEAVADCIHLKWRDQTVAGTAHPVSVASTSAGTYVTVHDGKGASEVARLRTEPGGLQIDYFQQDYIFSDGWRPRMRIAAIESCL
ncbi:Uncharacterised protein [Bordetella bronchiseptica]|nr:Uncharacterised protein [Bordetella bronchiseptica]